MQYHLQTDPPQTSTALVPYNGQSRAMIRYPAVSGSNTHDAYQARPSLPRGRGYSRHDSYERSHRSDHGQAHRRGPTERYQRSLSVDSRTDSSDDGYSSSENARHRSRRDEGSLRRRTRSHRADKKRKSSGSGILNTLVKVVIVCRALAFVFNKLDGSKNEEQEVPRSNRRTRSRRRA